MNKKELLRKSVHFSGVIYIPFYEIFGVETLSLSLLALLLIFGFFEFLRIKKGILKSAFRENEWNRLGAYFHSLLALTIITPFFHREAVFTAVSAAIVGDGFAGVLRTLSKERIASFSMFFSSLTVVYILGILNVFSLFATSFATFVERIKKVDDLRLEDNFTVPIAAAVAYSAVKYISNA